MKTLTKWQRRRNAEKLREHAFLEEEKYKLDFLRDCSYVVQALTIFLARNRGLTDAEVEEVELCIQYLSRGPIDGPEDV